MTLIAQHTVSLRATPENVWSKLINTVTWTMWDTQIQWAELDHGVKVGSKGKMKLKGSMPRSFRITDVNPQHSYTSEAKAAWIPITFEHRMKTSGDDVSLTFVISATGLAVDLFALLYGRGMRRSLPVSMANFKRQIESTGLSAR